MQISEQGVALVKGFEGFSATAYICPAGRLTIGYGHVVGAGEDFPDGVTAEQAEALLEADLQAAEQAVSRLVSVDISQNQFDALCSLTYNIGCEAFENSTLLRKLNAGDTQGAAAEFGRWVYAGERELPGLVARRAAEAAVFTG